MSYESRDFVRWTQQTNMKKIHRIYFCIVALGLCLCANAQKTIVTVNEFEGKDIISRDIYGHFSEHLGHCIYDGLWVGEKSSIPNVNGVRKDILDAMKEIKVPNLRWPGGCFADKYHWKDGIGPKESRPTMVNTPWSGLPEDNSFGTHEFLNMCEYVGTEPYISVNVGSGTVQEIAQWIEYMTFDGKSPMADLRRENGRDKPWKVKFIGIGNETWACGGNMTAEHYADVCRQYSTFMKSYSGNRLYKIGVGAGSTDYNWTEVLMRNASNFINGLSIHYYTIGNGRALEFDDEKYYQTMQRGYDIENIITNHSTIMDKYDPAKRVGLMVDEWGLLHTVEEGTDPILLYQQNCMRDAILAGMTLNIFNNHCDRVRMGNIAQFVNVVQSLFLTKDEKMIKTPTYHIFDMYKVHQDATLLPSNVITEKINQQTPEVVVSSSKNANGEINISFVNVSLTKDNEIDCILTSDSQYKANGGQILVSKDIHDHNSFEKPDEVKNAPFNNYSIRNNRLTFTLPAMSIVTICLK